MATIKRGRDAGTGRFIPIAEATRRKKTAIVETINIKRRKPKPKPTKPRRRH